MIRFKSIGKTLLTIWLCAFSAQLFSQASVTEAASPSTITCGECASLSANGSTIGNSVFLEDFNSGSPTGWAYTNQAMWNNPCSASGVDGTTHIWMGNNSGVPRILRTVSFDLSSAVAGVVVCFDMLFATQGEAAPCEGPDEPDEGVYLQYSIDGGTTWTTVNYFDPDGGYDTPYTTWNNWCFNLPPAAITANTIIRWYQDADSGQDYDHWGIDNVQIYMNDPTYEIIFMHDGYNAGYDGGTDPTPVCPTVTTTYQVMITNGTITAYDDVTIVVVPPVLVVDAGNDTTICAGQCADFDGNATVIVKPAKTPTYENNEITAVTGGDASVNINITDLNQTNVLPGAITSVCVNLFNFSGTQFCTDFFGCDCNGTPINFGDQCDLDISSFDVTLFSPGGCSILLVPAGVATGTDYIDVCFVPSGGAAITGGGFPTSGNWTPNSPISNLTGCTANGVWEMNFNAPGGLGFGLGFLGGWSISFIDPEISYTPTYGWSPTTDMTNSTTLAPTVCPLSTTTYTLSATDNAGCVVLNDDVTVTIDPGCCAVVLDNIASTDPACGTSNGTITITASGGVPPLQYSINNGSSFQLSNVFNGLSAGTFDIVVKDVNCNVTGQVTLIALPGPAISSALQVITPATCTASDGSIIGLSVSGGTPTYTYNWENSVGTGVGAALDLIAVPAGTYYLTVTDNYSCPTTYSAVIGNLTNPIFVGLGVDPSFCSGESVTLDAGSGYASYNWIPVAATQTVVASTNGTYSVTVTDNDGCTGTDQVIVTVNPLPTADAGSTQSVCDGASVNLTGTGGTGYLWSTGGATQTISVSPAIPTMYYVTVTDGNGCTDIDSVQITISAPPIPEAGSNQTICSASSVNLTASGGTSYVWSTTETTPVITVSPGITTTYYVNVTNNGCSAIDSVTVYVNSQLVLSISATPPAFCPGSSIQMDVSGGTTYSWGTGQTDASLTVSPSGTTTYFVTASDGTCTGDTSITVTEIPFPFADAGLDQQICVGASTSLNATGGSSYAWSSGGNVATENISPFVDSMYYVTVTDNGCSSVDSVFVSLIPLPDADAGPDATICNASTATLTASGGTSYNWSTGSTLQSISVTPIIQTDYYVTVTQSGCTDVDTVTVFVSNQLVISIIPDANPICEGEAVQLTASGGITYFWDMGETDQIVSYSPSTATIYSVTVTDGGICTGDTSITITVTPLPGTDAGVDQTICIGASALLTATGGTSYIWSSGGVLASETVAPVIPTMYYVTATTVGCSDWDSVFVDITPLPVANAGIDQTICIFSLATLSASGGSLYAWNTGETTADITVSPISQTTYFVTVTDIGCSSVDSLVVDINPLPVITIDPSATIICDGESVQLTANGGILYYWDLGQVTAVVNYSPSSTTTYTVYGTDANGCTSDTSITITVTPLPIANAGADQTICIGATTSLTASGGGSYAWNVGQMTQVIGGVGIGQYIVTVTSGGCTSSDTVIVSNYPTTAAGIDAAQTTICMGESVLLDAYGGVSYIWGGGEVTSSITPSPLSATIYFVTVTNANACTGTASIAISVNSLPIADAGENQSICSTAGTVLTATGGTSYFWNTNSPTQNISVTPASTTTYFVTVTDNGCSSVDSVTVTVNSPVVADISTVLPTVCMGDSTQLTASGGTSFLWSNAATTATISVSPPVITIYSVTVTDDLGCTGIDQIQIDVNDSVIIVVSPPVICEGGFAQLTASGGTTYAWSTSQNTQSITVSPVSTSTYSVTVTNNGCSASTDVVVTVVPLPIADAGSDQVICAGSFATLIASGGTSYQWNTGATDASISVSPSSSQTYTIIVTENGCTATDNVLVNVTPLPIVDLGTDQNSCQGDLVTLTAGLADSYLWSNGATSQSITISDISSSVYSVIVTNNNCSAFDDVNVVVGALPPADAGDDITLCPGVSALLVVTGGSEYNWSTQSTNDSIVVSPSAPTVFYVTVSDGSCSSTDSVIVSVNATIVASITASPSELCYSQSSLLTASGGATYLWNTGAVSNTITVTPPTSTIFFVTATSGDGCIDSTSIIISVDSNITAASSPSAICEGESTVLTVSSGLSYTWNTGETSQSITVSPLSTTSYYVTVYGSICTDSTNVPVVVHTLPVADAGADRSVCLGSSATIVAMGGTYYVWSNSMAGDTISVSPSTESNYYVTVTDQYGCTDSDDVKLSIYPLPVANAGSDKIICEGDKVQLLASGGNVYAWSPALFLDTPFTANPVSTPDTSTTYSVLVTDGNGCTDTDDITVIVNPTLLVNVEVFANPNDSICTGEQIAFTAIATNAGSNPVYQWKVNSLNVGTNTSSYYSSLLQDNDMVSCILYSSEACVSNNPAVDFVPLSIFPQPIPVLIPGTRYGCDPLRVKFNEFVATNDHYTWDFGDNSSSAFPSPEHMYQNVGSYDVSVTVTSDFGCSSSLTYHNLIDVFGVPEANFYPDPVVTDLFDPTVVFLNSTTGGLIDDCSFGDGTYASYQSGLDFSHVYKTSGNFDVVLIAHSSQGCSDTARTMVLVRPVFTFYAPNAFIPEGEASNAVFYVTGIGISDKNFHLYIYDRWGELVFDSEKYNAENPAMYGWDGDVKEHYPAPAGVYTWLVVYEEINGDSQTRSGAVAVIR